jgi:hypothetical protein
MPGYHISRGGLITMGNPWPMLAYLPEYLRGVRIEE